MRQVLNADVAVVFSGGRAARKEGASSPIDDGAMFYDAACHTAMREGDESKLYTGILQIAFTSPPAYVPGHQWAGPRDSL